MDENKLDYKKMFENLFGQITKYMDIQTEYFKLLQEMADIGVDDNMREVVSANMLKLDISDQIILLKAAIYSEKTIKYLYEKYEFESQKEEVEDDEIDA